jgi:hypothetical protein
MVKMGTKMQYTKMEDTKMEETKMDMSTKGGLSKIFPRLQRQISVVDKEEDTDAALSAAAVAAEQENEEAMVGDTAVAGAKKVSSSLKKKKLVCPVAPTLIRNGTVLPRPRREASTLIFEEDIRERPPDMNFYAGADKFLFHLGGCKYLIINQGAGVAGPSRLRICELTTDPSRKTVLVRLNLQQWVDLCSWSDIIHDVIEKEKQAEGSGVDEEDGQKRMHLGGNVYMSIKRGLPGVDFRWFWLPPSATVDYQQEPGAFNVQPTRYGIWLNYKEWYKLDGLRDLVQKCIPSLEGMNECASQHLNQEGILLCVHCNPNGHHVWI